MDTLSTEIENMKVTIIFGVMICYVHLKSLEMSAKSLLKSHKTQLGQEMSLEKECGSVDCRLQLNLIAS